MITIVSVFFLIAGLCGMIGTAGWILRRGNSSPMTHLFIVCELSITIWIISQLMILFSVNDRQLWISYLIGNAGICCFAPFWLMFSAEYSEVGASAKNLIRTLPALAAAMFAFIAANPLHKLYYAEFSKNGITYGGLFYVFQILFYIFILSGIAMMLIRHSRRSTQIPTQSMLLALAAAVPLMINTLTVTRIIRSRIELTPLFFAFSVIMVLIAIRRYGLLNINRIAINDTIGSIETAVIVFDADGDLTYKNRFAETNFPLDDISSLDELTAKLSELSGHELSSDLTSAEIQLGGEHYSLRRSLTMNRKGAVIAQVVMISNVTEYYELALAEKKLSLEQERNRIAQEIHDSAGHTFTMISSLAKIIRAESAKGNLDDLNEYLDEIDGLSRSGVTQLRCSINNLRDDEFMTSVTRAIQTVTTAIRGIKIDLCIQGTEDGSFAFCIREVYDNTRETLTNAMRYSGADRIDVIVKFLADRLELYIFDNGRGCPDIKENNGLSGIRKRTEAIGGTVRFASVDGEGFNTIIKIPKGAENNHDKGNDS